MLVPSGEAVGGQGVPGGVVPGVPGVPELPCLFPEVEDEVEGDEPGLEDPAFGVELPAMRYFPGLVSAKLSPERWSLAAAWLESPNCPEASRVFPPALLCFRAASLCFREALPSPEFEFVPRFLECRRTCRPQAYSALQPK